MKYVTNFWEKIPVKVQTSLEDAALTIAIFAVGTLLNDQTPVMGWVAAHAGLTPPMQVYAGMGLALILSRIMGWVTSEKKKVDAVVVVDGNPTADQVIEAIKANLPPVVTASTATSISITTTS